jgi:hypothetical protein
LGHRLGIGSSWARPPSTVLDILLMKNEDIGVGCSAFKEESAGFILLQARRREYISMWPLAAALCPVAGEGAVPVDGVGEAGRTEA